MTKQQNKIKINKKLYVFSLFFTAFLTGGACFFAITNYLKYFQNRKQIQQEVVFWKKRAAETPLYPDSWVKLALLWQTLGERDWAKLAITKAQKLDPIRKDIKDVAAKISNF